MGLLRKVACAASGLLFSISLLLLISVVFFLNITDYDNARGIFLKIFPSVLNKSIGAEQIDHAYAALSLLCMQRSTVSFPFENDSISLECSEFVNTNSTNLLYLISTKFFNSIYYKDYGCEFVQCLQGISSPVDAIVVFSSTAHDFFNNLLLPVAIATVLTGVAFFFSIETWSGRFKTFGLYFLLNGIFFFILPYIKSFVLLKLPLEAADIAGSVVDAIFDLISPILLIFLLLGIVFIFVWIAGKFIAKKTTSKKSK
jgi:hypothetical protein